MHPPATDDPLSACSSQDLRALAEAARDMQRCQRVMAKTGETVFALLDAEPETLVRWLHYPKGDVYDPEFHSQYYLHRHPLPPTSLEESAHIHTFLRPYGMPDGVQPVIEAGGIPLDDPNDALSHLIAISLDRAGRPIRLFTTNRWVTGETWYPADDVVRMLDHFVIDVARPSWLLNCWLTALMRLFRPQIAALLYRRDAAVAAFGQGRPLALVLDDRNLEVTSSETIDVTTQMATIDRRLRLGPG